MSTDHNHNHTMPNPTSCPTPAVAPDAPRWLRWSIDEDVQAIALALALVAAAQGDMLGRGRMPTIGDGLRAWTAASALDAAVTLLGGGTFIWLLQRLRGGCTDTWWPTAVALVGLAATGLSFGAFGSWSAALVTWITGVVAGLLWPRPVAAAGGLHGAALARVAAALVLWTTAGSAGRDIIDIALGLGTVVIAAGVVRLTESGSAGERAQFGGPRRWPWRWAMVVAGLGGAAGMASVADAALSARAHAALNSAAVWWALMAIGRLGVEWGSVAGQTVRR